jgi:hypothetical protein
MGINYVYDIIGYHLFIFRYKNCLLFRPVLHSFLCQLKFYVYLLLESDDQNHKVFKVIFFHFRFVQIESSVFKFNDLLLFSNNQKAFIFVHLLKQLQKKNYFYLFSRLQLFFQEIIRKFLAEKIHFKQDS